MRVLALATVLAVTGCATEKGNVRHAQHASDQVRIVAVQREAMVQEAKAEADTQQALVEALARVAEANPQEASSVAVALAVMGVRDSQGKPRNTPIVSLQRPTNEALEWTKALAPTIGGLVTGVGIAAINAETQRNASDNNRDILLGDQAADRGIVEAVAGLGGIAAAQTGSLWVVTICRFRIMVLLTKAQLRITVRTKLLQLKGISIRAVKRMTRLTPRLWG